MRRLFSQVIFIKRVVAFIAMLLGMTVATHAQDLVVSHPVTVSRPMADARDWGFWVNTEAMYLSLGQKVHSTPMLEGPESVSLGSSNFGWQPSGRMTVGYFEGDYEITGSYLFQTSWNTGSSGFLAHPVVFDGPNAYFATPVPVQAAIDTSLSPNFITPNTLFSVMHTAANSSGETDALEFLRRGARFQLQERTTFSDLEINLNQREEFDRWWRFGMGFRHSQVRQSGFGALAGTFGTFISSGVGVPFNNGLSDGAITGAGLTLSSGTGTNNGFSDATLAPLSAADQLLFTSRAKTNNELYGVQVMAEAFLYQQPRFSWSVFGKPGVYYNQATGNITETYADTLNDKSSYARSLSDRKSTFSFLGQIGTTCRYYLWENVSLSAGYDLYYLTGLALAADQMSQITVPVTGAPNYQLRTDGTVLVHGGRVGLEIAF